MLDIGSSVGSFQKSKKFAKSRRSLEEVAQYITVDIDPTSNADVIADAHKLPFDDGAFDIVIANNVIEHLSEPRTGVSEIHRVLVANGVMYFTIPFLYPVHEAPHDYQRFTKFGLRKLFCEFEEVEIFERGGWFSTVADMIFKLTNIFDRYRAGSILRCGLFAPLWLFVQLDRFDKSGAFTRVYFGSVTK